MVLSLVCQTTSYGANHSQDQDLPSVSWGNHWRKKTRNRPWIWRYPPWRNRQSWSWPGSWQYFTVNTGVRSVGVIDSRTYDYIIAIRAITSIDGWQLTSLRFSCEVPKISVRISKEVDHVNRIVYDITSKPPATVEWGIKKKRSGDLFFSRA